MALKLVKLGRSEAKVESKEDALSYFAIDTPETRLDHVRKHPLEGVMWYLNVVTGEIVKHGFKYRK